MKIFSFAVLALLVSLLAGVNEVQAQSGTYTKDAVFSAQYPGATLRFTCALDSIDADTSRAFSIGKYDGQRWTTVPVHAQKLITSAVGKPYVTVYLDGSFDNSNWFACDTLVTADSVETAGLIEINFSNKKFPWYRVRSNGIAYGAGKNRTDTIFDMIWYLYQENQ